MLRFAIALLAAVIASGAAESAERTVARHGWHRAAAGLPAGLPRSHYKFRTTISYGAPNPYRRAYAPRLSVYETPQRLYAPDYADVSYIRPLTALPLLPDPSTLPYYGSGYYGSGYPYDYQGSYFGGPYVGYWANGCGLYGDCY
jgi:hypothetical protein